MNAHVFLDLPEFLPDVLIRASLAMLVTAAGILLILKWTRMRSPTVHRIAWMAVLIQGCILTRVACEIPWYEPVGPTAQTANDSGATLGVGDSLNQIGLSDTESDSRSTTGGWQESVATVPGIDSGRVTGVVGEPAVSGVNWALANDVWWNPQTWSTWNQLAAWSCFDGNLDHGNSGFVGRVYHRIRFIALFPATNNGIACRVAEAMATNYVPSRCSPRHSLAGT